MREYHLSYAQIGALTPYQERWHLARTKDDDPPEADLPRALTPRQAFWHVCREGRDMTEEETQRLWDYLQKRQAEKK